MEERLQDPADEPVDQRVDALVPCAGVQGGVLHDQRYPVCGGSLQLSQMALNGTRTLRGALAGAAGAAVWAAQQPLDKKGVRRRVRRRRAARQALSRASRRGCRSGSPRTSVNGAAFGAIYANVAPCLPGPRAGPRRAARAGRALRDVAGDDPARPRASRRRRLPALWGNPRAFAQATWRHALFGFVLGELERRLNPPADTPAPIDDAAVASNGHGSAEHLVAAVGPVD